MSLTLDLPPELESELSSEASRCGLPLAEYVVRLLASARVPASSPSSGSELVAYWRDEGLIGSRMDIDDSQQHARALRERAERRERPS